MKNDVKALIITGFGLNCENETAVAFEVAGATADKLHLNDLTANKNRLHKYQILAFIGGFSFGDHLGAGTVFASRIKHALHDDLEKFINDGKLIIGICNGMQTMARLGLIPAIGARFFEPQAALTHNDQNCFRDDWVTLKANPNSPCVFTKGIDLIPMPIRHGEGKFVMMNEEEIETLEANNQIALQYANPVDGEPTQEFPKNPNGSTRAIAGVCDPSGRIFGLMPHPEAYLSPLNHPHWQRQKINGILPKEGLGQKIFTNAVEFAKRNF